MVEISKNTFLPDVPRPQYEVTAPEKQAKIAFSALMKWHKIALTCGPSPFVIHTCNPPKKSQSRKQPVVYIIIPGCRDDGNRYPVAFSNKGDVALLKEVDKPETYPLKNPIEYEGVAGTNFLLLLQAARGDKVAHKIAEYIAKQIQATIDEAIKRINTQSSLLPKVPNLEVIS